MLRPTGGDALIRSLNASLSRQAGPRASVVDCRARATAAHCPRASVALCAGLAFAAHDGGAIAASRRGQERGRTQAPTGGALTRPGTCTRPRGTATGRPERWRLAMRQVQEVEARPRVVGVVVDADRFPQYCGHRGRRYHPYPWRRPRRPEWWEGLRASETARITLARSCIFRSASGSRLGSIVIHRPSGCCSQYRCGFSLWILSMALSVLEGQGSTRAGAGQVANL